MKIKHENEKGVSVTTENVIGQNALSAKLTTKYLYAPWNVSVDKLVIDPKGDVQGEVSLEGLSPGLKLKAAADSKLKGEGGFEYTTSALALKVSNFMRITTSFVLVCDGRLTILLLCCFRPTLTWILHASLHLLQQLMRVLYWVVW